MKIPPRPMPAALMAAAVLLAFSTSGRAADVKPGETITVANAAEVRRW